MGEVNKLEESVLNNPSINTSSVDSTKEHARKNPSEENLITMTGSVMQSILKAFQALEKSQEAMRNANDEETSRIHEEEGRKIHRRKAFLHGVAGAAAGALPFTPLGPSGSQLAASFGQGAQSWQDGELQNRNQRALQENEKRSQAEAERRQSRSRTNDMAVNSVKEMQRNATESTSGAVRSEGG